MEHNISIIIPIYNEEKGIDRLVKNLNAYFQKHANLEPEVIFVDDGSSDNSVKAIKKLKHVNYSAKLIKLTRNYGSHLAIRAGIQVAAASVVTFISSDLQDPLSLIGNMYAEMKEGNDLIWAKRRKIENKFIANFSTKLYAKLMKLFVFCDFPENGFDVVMFSDKIKNELNRNIEANSSIFLQIMNMGFHSSTITYDKKARQIGGSKWNFSKKIKLLIDSFVSFSYAPIRFVSVMGLVLSTVGFIWAIYISLRAIMSGNLNPGWPSLIAILTIGFGVTNLSLGIIAEYLWRTLDISRKRSAFLIDEMINL